MKIDLYVQETVDEHCRTWNPEETRDFIDSFLTEIEKNKTNEDSQFSGKYGSNSFSFHNTLCLITNTNISLVITRLSSQLIEQLSIFLY